MNTLKKLSQKFYRISKILLIVFIAVTPFVAVLFLLDYQLISSMIRLGAVEQAKEETEMMSLCFLVFGIYCVVQEILNIVCLVINNIARNKNSQKLHILSIVFGVISGTGQFSSVAGILSLCYLKRDGKFDGNNNDLNNQAIDVNSIEKK